jgi:hypothetical protein
MTTDWRYVPSGTTPDKIKPAPAHAADVANTIRQQLGVMGLGVVGAHNLMSTSEQRGGLTFNARLHYQGQSRARIMRVTITLTGMDLYDVVVSTPDYRNVTVAESYYAIQLTGAMYDLDAEGVPK